MDRLYAERDAGLGPRCASLHHVMSLLPSRGASQACCCSCAPSIPQSAPRRALRDAHARPVAHGRVQHAPRRPRAPRRRAATASPSSFSCTPSSCDSYPSASAVLPSPSRSRPCTPSRCAAPSTREPSRPRLPPSPAHRRCSRAAACAAPSHWSSSPRRDPARGRRRNDAGRGRWCWGGRATGRAQFSRFRYIGMLWALW